MEREGKPGLVEAGANVTKKVGALLAVVASFGSVGLAVALGAISLAIHGFEQSIKNQRLKSA